MLRVVCVDAHDYCGRGVEYVQKLHDMVRRNLPEGYPGTFTVFTDGDADYGEGIEVRKLPGHLAGWFNKLYLFKDGLFSSDDRILFMDLDTVITGKLDALVAYSGPFGIIGDFYRPDRLQSAIMAWQGNTLTDIWSSYEKAWCPNVPGGDQAWIERYFRTAAIQPDILNKSFPGLLASYKGDGCQIDVPKGVAIVCFHGHPRPHEVTDGWVPHVWKIGGGTLAMLESVCNTEERTLLQNVREASARALPWLDLVPAHDRVAVIAGGGPSLAETEFVAGQDVFALNKAAQWLAERGIALHAQVILDARPEMADMIEPSAPLHILASQCHPAVFPAAGPQALVFHPNIPGIERSINAAGRPVHLIGGGSTVGLQAMVIAYVLGYRRIHLAGMDGSYRDGEGHAYAQSLNDGERTIEVIVGGQTFKAAPWMAQQAEEFQVVAAELANMGCEIVIGGDGLLPAVARELAALHARSEANIIEVDDSPPCQRALAVLERLDGLENPVGAEIGVFCGEMSRKLLGLRPDLTLYMIDSWAPADPTGHYAESGDYHADKSQAHHDGCARRAAENVAFAGDRAIILRNSSVDAAAQIPDGTLDFVFIDADHSYEGCRADIDAWMPKLKPGGLLSGHDYSNPNFPGFGVNRAVEEFAWRHGLCIELGENLTWFVRLPALRSVAAA